jgi:hypothetical protein
MIRPFRTHKRGVSRSSRTLDAGCDGRVGIAGRAMRMRTAKPCGPDPPMLGSSFSEIAMSALWARHAEIREVTVAKKPGHRGERGISCRTVVQGMPRCCGEPAVTNSCVFYSTHEAAGAASIRHSLRPLSFEGHYQAKLGRIAPREYDVTSTSLTNYPDAGAARPSLIVEPDPDQQALPFAPANKRAGCFRPFRLT